MEIMFDETWKEVLDLLRNYEILEATLRENEGVLALEEMNDAHVVLVKAELQGGITEGSHLDALGIDVEKLFWILKVYGTPCRAEIRGEDGVIHLLPPASSESSDLPVDEAEETLSVKEPSPEKTFDLAADPSVEAKDVELGFPLHAAEKIHGIEGFQATICSEAGKLLFDYWTEDSMDGNKSVLGEAQGDEVSATYHPELLEPLNGEWDLQLGEELPLRGEKVLDGGEGDWKADVTVIVAPKVKNVSRGG